MADIRKWVLDSIKPTLPNRFKLVPYVNDAEQISTPTCFLVVDEITRTPEAPKVGRDVDYILYLVEPKTEPGRADDAIDNELFTLLDALDDTKSVYWTKATRATWAESNPAYQITLRALIQKD